MKKFSRGYILSVVKQLLGKEKQLSLFPFADDYRLVCNNPRMCDHKDQCDLCMFSDIERLDYDSILSPNKY